MLAVRVAASNLPPNARGPLLFVGTIAFVIVSAVIAAAIASGGAEGSRREPQSPVGVLILMGLLIAAAVALWRRYRTTRRAALFTVVVLVAVWLSISIGIQFGALFGIATFVGTALIASRAERLLGFVKGAAMSIALAVAVSVYRIVGTHSAVRDAICLAIALLILWLLARFLPAIDRLETSRAGLLVGTLFAVVLLWAVVSIADILFGSRIRQPAVRPMVETRVRIAAALSGGGYRAAIFHAGVLAELERQGIYPRALATVSGGSIAGSFYATGGDPRRFARAVEEGTFNLKREVLNIRYLPRLVLSARLPFTRVRLVPIEPVTTTTVQAAMLDRLYLDGRTFRRLPTWPALMVCTTDLVNGNAVGVTAAGSITAPILEVSRRLEAAGARPAAQVTDDLPRNEPLSRIVAASGAFPGALPPYAVPPRPLTVEGAAEEEAMDDFLHGFDSGSPRFPEWMTKGTVSDPAMLLADGGLTDNIGTGLLKQAIAMSRTHPAFKPFDVDLILASDASALFTRGDTPRTALNEVARALDTVYLGTGESSLPKPGRDTPVITLSAAALAEPRANCLADYDALSENEQGLNALIQVMPDSVRAKARQEAERNAANPFRVAERSSTDLVPAIRDELSSCLCAFSSFSTLEDRPTKIQAEAAYQLGRYVVALQANRIRCAIGNIEAARPGRPAVDCFSAAASR